MAEAGDRIGEGELSAERLALANINPSTGLATDYLNHFNEVIMLLELVPAMPDCTDDVLRWRPRTYQEHFRSSRFAEKELAIRAYEAAPHAIKATFDTLIAEVESEVLRTQDQLANTGPSDYAEITAISSRACDGLKPLLASAGGVIHGHDIDRLMNAEAENESSQADIDALFA